MKSLCFSCANSTCKLKNFYKKSRGIIVEVCPKFVRKRQKSSKNSKS